jgi:Arc/MetJ family transcription regulator
VACPGRSITEAIQRRRTDILLGMAKTSVEVDQDIARQAAAILGTKTLRATIDAALREVVHARRRIELVALLSQDGRFDFDLVQQAWGADE